MFDFDTGKLVVIGIVALVVIGPKELPRVLRTVGQTIGKVRRMAGEFQAQFMEAMREAEMADVKDEMGKIADAAKIDVAFDPVRTIRNQISGAIEGAPAPALTTVTETGNSVDLSRLEAVAAPVASEADAETAIEGGLVGAGIAPVTELSDGAYQRVTSDDAPAGLAATGLAATGLAPPPETSARAFHDEAADRASADEGKVPASAHSA